MTFCTFVSYSSFNQIYKCLDSTANRAILFLLFQYLWRALIYIYIYIYMCVCACMYASMCVYACIYVCVCVYVCMHVYIYLCVCVCVCVCVIIVILFLLFVSFCSFFLGFFCCQEKLSKSINPKQFMITHFFVHMVCFLVTLGSSATIKSHLSNRSQLHTELQKVIQWHS